MPRFPGIFCRVLGLAKNLKQEPTGDGVAGLAPFHPGEWERERESLLGPCNSDVTQASFLIDRFAVIGPPENHVRRLVELSEAGVDQFNLYLMSGDEEAQLEAYGSTIIPAFRNALAGA